MKNIKRITLILALIGTTFSIAQESIIPKEKLVDTVHENETEYDSLKILILLKKSF